MMAAAPGPMNNLPGVTSRWPTLNARVAVRRERDLGVRRRGYDIQTLSGAALTYRHRAQQARALSRRPVVDLKAAFASCMTEQEAQDRGDPWGIKIFSSRPYKLID